MFLQKQPEIDDIIQEYYPKIYYFLYRRTKDEELSKDLCQETFIQFFSTFDSYQEHGKMLNYLYKIALHKLYDVLRKQKEIETFEEAEDQTFNPEITFFKKENILFLRKWITALPIQLQDVIYFRYYEQLTFREIAKVTDTNVSTIKSQHQKAITLLRTFARKEGWSEDE